MPNRNIQFSDSLFDSIVTLRNKNATKKNQIKEIRKGNCETKKRRGNCETEDRNRILDASSEAKKHKTVTREQGLMIQNNRNKKGLTRKQLANQIGVKPDIIAQYENGKAIINNQIIGKLERKLNINLRNKK